MVEKVIIAGAGGQGIMLLGKVLAEAAMRIDRHITFMPSYGAEVRGGTAHCMIVISDEEIGSPYIQKADTLIIMNEPSLKKFRDRIENNGLLIVNSSLAISDNEINKPNHTRILRYPFTDKAVELGNIKVANMVALGCYIAANQAIDITTALEVIKDIAPPDKKHLVEINKNAILAGMKLVKPI